MKYKIICMMLILALTFGMVGLFSVSAENDYEKLWQEKRLYEIKNGYGDGLIENQWAIYYECSWRFIPYTEAGKKLTYEVKTEELGEYGYPPHIFLYGMDSVVYSQKLVDIYHESLIIPNNDRPGVCNTRKMIQELGITEEDMRNAFDRMKNEPESAREVLSWLSDEEFESYLFMIEQYLAYLEEFPIPDFVISAYFLENDEEAQYLLSQEGAVYVPELGYALYERLLLSDSVSVEEIAGYDLTTPGFGYFLENRRSYSGGGHVYKDGRTAKEKLEYLEAAREAQLKAAQTGDGAVNALWVVALAVPALAAVVLAKRKRRI